jgi:hypothetical protein
MGNSVIFVVISSLFVMLVCSSSFSVLAVKSPSPRDVCDVFGGSVCNCGNNVEELTATCCALIQGEPGKQVMVCERCSINTNTGEYYNCEVSRKSPTTGQANVPQGGGVIEQPPTSKKHGGTVLPGGGGTIEQPQSSKHSPKDNTKLPNDSGGSVEQQQEQSPLLAPPLKPKGGHNINPATGSK